VRNDLCRNAGILQGFKRLESEDVSGTLTLKSPLDLAVHILNYRLSRATTPAVQEISKYHISLLCSKITKTYKKVSSVVSPVSVSPSCYSVLSVDGMDCDSNCTLPSKGVPAKGSAPDVKSSVLNSQLNKDNLSPSLASEEPESPASNSEVPMDLRRSFTMEREVMVPVHICGPLNAIEVDALLDSGATGCFVDKSWALDRQLQLSKLVKPVPVLNIDGTRNQEGDITHYVLLTIGIGKHAEKLWCAVTCLGKVPLILGHTWLRKHNPDIDWVTGKVNLTWCPPECRSLLETRFAKLLRENESQETWVQALKAHESKVTIDESTLEDAQKQVPKEYWEFLDVFSKKSLEHMPLQKPWDHGIDLKEDFPPKKGRLILLSVDEQKEVKSFLDDQLAKGYIRPSISQQTSPVFFIPKKDGKKRMVQDYRYVNNWTIKNNYPLPLISQLVDKLKGCKLFTKMDLWWGYNNVRICKGNEWKAAFVTHKGAFEPLVMYFGLCNSPATFQKMMNEIFHDMLDVCMVYIDDLMIFTDTDDQEKHDRIVLEVLKRLHDNDLFVKPEKCRFRVTKVDFLGMIVSRDGIKMDPEKVNTILKWPEPTNVKQVQAFLGLGNFYRCFIKDYAIMARPMTDLTCKNTVFTFREKEHAAFEALKAAFTCAPVLQYPNQDHKFCLETDASEFTVGGVISVKCEDSEFRPVAYMSHSMTPPKRNYPIHDKEMLAIIKATEAWRHYLKATPYAFEIYMDHHNLMYFTKSQNLSKRQACWQMWMTHFNYLLIYKKGTQMHIADPLSRRSDYYISSSEDNKDQTLLNPVSIKLIDVTDQTYEEHQSLVMDFHDTPIAGHKGVKATYNTLRNHYTWKGMKEQIQTYVKHCQKCQQSKVSNQKTSGSLVPLPTPSGPWLDVTMDFTEMPESLGYNYILVVIDRFSKEVVFVPCTKEETTLSTAELFMDHVWCQHGLPSSVVSDHGLVFASNFLGELYRLLGVKCKMSTAFHPQTDGQTERLNREINQYL